MNPAAAPIHATARTQRNRGSRRTYRAALARGGHPLRSAIAYCTWNFGDVRTVPATVQSGVSTELLNASDEFVSLHVTTLLGPQVPSSVTFTFTLLIDNCVVLSACPVHGDVLLALPLISEHVAPPVNVVDVMLTIPVDVIVPLKVAVQPAVIAPLLRFVAGRRERLAVRVHRLAVGTRNGDSEQARPKPR